MDKLSGAHLMAFSVSAMFKNGIIYYPGVSDGPGAIEASFTYKFGEDGPEIDANQLVLGVASSTCQRKGKFSTAVARLR